MRRLGIRMHGIALELRSDSEALLAYVASALRHFVVPPPVRADVEVVARWSEGDGPDAPESPVSNGNGRTGADAGATPRVAIDTLRDRDLDLGVRRIGATHCFDVHYRHRISEKKRRNHPDHEYRKRFELLRWIVLHPIAWTLERRHSWVLLHGAYVARDGRGVLLAGAGGAGKTTTAMAVARRAGMTVIGENLLLWDGASMHGIGEPARAEAASVAIADPEQAGLERLDTPGGSGKLLYRLAPEASRSSRPAAIFLLEPGAPAIARRMPAAEAHERLLALHRMTTEIRDYDAFTAALDLAWPEPGHADALRARFATLSRATPVHRLGIDRSAGIDAAVDTILDALGTEQEAPWTPR